MEPRYPRGQHLTKYRKSRDRDSWEPSSDNLCGFTCSLNVAGKQPGDSTLTQARRRSTCLTAADCRQSFSLVLPFSSFFRRLANFVAGFLTTGFPFRPISAPSFSSWDTALTQVVEQRRALSQRSPAWSLSTASFFNFIVELKTMERQFRPAVLSQ